MKRNGFYGSMGASPPRSVRLDQVVLDGRRGGVLLNDERGHLEVAPSHDLRITELRQRIEVLEADLKGISLRLEQLEQLEQERLK